MADHSISHYLLNVRSLNVSVNLVTFVVHYTTFSEMMTLLCVMLCFRLIISTKSRCFTNF